MARYGTERLSSGRFAFPLQFSTALEWAGLFTCRYSCAAYRVPQAVEEEGRDVRTGVLR